MMVRHLCLSKKNTLAIDKTKAETVLSINTIDIVAEQTASLRVFSKTLFFVFFSAQLLRPAIATNPLSNMVT